MTLVNRSAITVQPRSPMLQWRQTFHPPGEPDPLQGDSSIYLIATSEDAIGQQQELLAVYGQIFEAELELWCRDRQRWPADRSLAVFRHWFEVQHHHLVEDLGRAPLQHQRCDPELPGLLRQLWRDSPSGGTP